jgi:Zn finger protein HypA/HybF involved in hydrogenase expression
LRIGAGCSFLPASTRLRLVDGEAGWLLASLADKNGMHDFLLAKEIIDEVLKIAKEKKLSRVKKVFLEIGQIAMAHGGHEEHVEDISIENLRFGIETIARGTILEKTAFDIKKVSGEHWKITEIMGQ